MTQHLSGTTFALAIVALFGIALLVGLASPVAVAQGELPDMESLGRYHFEYGTTQGWIVQPEGSGVSSVVSPTTTAAWTGTYGLDVRVSGTSGDWVGAAGVDDPTPGMMSAGTVTAHLSLPLSSSATWAQFYVLDQNWNYFRSSQTILQPGSWVTLTWNLSSTGAIYPIHRFGIQFGGTASDTFNDFLTLDAVTWSQPTYTQPIYTGAALGTTAGLTITKEVDWLDTAGGKHGGLINIFANWPEPFPTEGVDAILAHQSTPLITWQPFVPLADITAGLYDDYIDAWAQAIAQTRLTVFLRWGHEMNGCVPTDTPPCWYPWGGDPAGYVAAWRYIHDRIELANAVKNVVWVWTPNISQGNVFADYPSYYPGDTYVDWVGASGYNAASKATWDPKPACLSFDELFSPILSDMARRYAKPQLIPEFASACANGCDKVLWLTEAYYQARFHPRLQALVWFNVAKWEGEGTRQTWVDWRIGCGDCDAPTCPECVAAYGQALADARFSPATPGTSADVDANCVVDVADAQRVADAWARTAGSEAYNWRLDLDHSGVVDIIDLMLVSRSWQSRC